MVGNSSAVEVKDDKYAVEGIHSRDARLRLLAEEPANKDGGPQHAHSLNL